MIDRADDVNRTEPPAATAFAQRYRGEAMLEVRGLKKYFPITRGFWSRTVGHVKAVDGVSFATGIG